MQLTSHGILWHRFGTGILTPSPTTNGALVTVRFRAVGRRIQGLEIGLRPKGYVGNRTSYSQIKSSASTLLGFLKRNPQDDFWEEMFVALVTFKNKYNHCNVPRAFRDNPKLGTWVINQRHLGNQKKLPATLKRRLEALGFVWNTLDEGWEQMFTVLADYRRQNGNCKVPQNWRDNPKLGKWVQHQRNSRRTGALSEERIHRLDKIGFQWKPSKGPAIKEPRSPDQCR